MRRAPALVALVGGCLFLAAGCGGGIQIGPPPGEPACVSADGRVADAVILVAQSVPSAQQVPCLRALPVGWMFQRLDAQSGRTRVLLGTHDRDGEHRVTVALDAGCDVTGAREVSSPQPDIRRYDRVVQASRGYRADWYYLFTGGCATYHFELSGRAGAEAATELSTGLGFVSRSTVAAAVRERSHGRFTLDPGGQE